MILKKYFSGSASKINDHTTYLWRLHSVFKFPKQTFPRILFFSVLITVCFSETFGVDTASYISPVQGKGRFALSASGYSAPLYISTEDYPGVIRVARQLQADIGRVTDAEPEFITGDNPACKEIVLIGTLGESPVIDRLVSKRKINVEGIAGKWEAFLIEVVEKPFPDVKQALVIAGSDKRGTIYGIYDLSSQIGVSPWYWWADVPVKKKKDIYVLPGRHTAGEPAVKYRGIFINDEAPSLSGWAFEKFGGFNHEFYEKVFELILRLKGNYLWPAMWGRAFYDDDTLNPVLADEYGIIIGTSHHEPLMQAHDEWRRYGSGEWNYEKNEETLKSFWKHGIERMGSKESIVTIGMRGDGDEPMTEGTAIALLERIVKDQREIIEEVTGKPASETPQMWALYKEVQDYYNKGMRVPDDVILLLCDDNWGNIRLLPDPEDPPRPGGYGIYYHFDYVGGPRNYKWLNTNQIERVWEQMHLAYSYGVNRLWIVNVGDIKPMEFPIEFFLDYAWNPDKWTAERLQEYYLLWAEEQFGSNNAKTIADIIALYTKYNSRQKPELLSPETYSIINYREAEIIAADYHKLAEQAEQIYKSLSPEYRDAFYQLVLYPVKACANLNELYVTAGKNHLYTKQGRAATNDLAKKAESLFAKDAEYSCYYNESMADGKWNHIMDQTHIGYTYWQQPEKNVMPEVYTIEIPSVADMGVSVEGSGEWWPGNEDGAVLPVFDPYHRQSFYIEIFNRGTVPFHFSTRSEAPWLIVAPDQGSVGKEQRLYVSVDWQNLPTGEHHIPITISGPNNTSVIVQAVIHNPEFQEPEEVKGFIESNGFISIEAERFDKVTETDQIKWQCIPNLGRTLSGITPVPVTSQSQEPAGDSPHLEYQIYLFDTGNVRICVYLSPTLNFKNSKGLKYALSIDDETPQIINIHSDNSLQAWEKSVSDNIKILTSVHHVTAPGKHILNFWMVDPGVVLQKIVIETGEVKPSYLGPPESVNALKRISE